MLKIKLRKMGDEIFNFLVYWGWCVEMVSIVDLIFMLFNYIDFYYFFILVILKLDCYKKNIFL